mmetsp:Transcript_2951/g.9980  ORF Transcript_2951/g.9980 Transcript_2951/m.9980 type:complete len:312 (-) Transcript_2951:1248-2183(-)
MLRIEDSVLTQRALLCKRRGAAAVRSCRLCVARIFGAPPCQPARRPLPLTRAAAWQRTLLCNAQPPNIVTRNKQHACGIVRHCHAYAQPECSPWGAQPAGPQATVASLAAGALSGCPSSNCAASFSRSTCMPSLESTAPPPKAMAPCPLTPAGALAAHTLSAISGRIALRPLVGLPAARSATTSAASLPARTAPSMEPRNFWEVQSPASVKRSMGVCCDGRYLLRPGMAAYTDRGVLTTANLRRRALPAGPCFPVAGHRGSFAISVGKRRASSPMVASIMSSSDFPIQLVLPPASLEHGANTSSSIERSSS